MKVARLVDGDKFYGFAVGPNDLTFGSTYTTACNKNLLRAVIEYIDMNYIPPRLRSDHPSISHTPP